MQTSTTSLPWSVCDPALGQEEGGGLLSVVRATCDRKLTAAAAHHSGDSQDKSNLSNLERQQKKGSKAEGQSRSPPSVILAPAR
jgi:hypothetical protein